MTDPIQNPSEEDVARWHRTFGPMAFNHTWSLLDLDELTRAQEEEMLAAALAQRYHWYNVGTPQNRAIADWQVSRVAAVMGYAELSARFGQLSLDLATDNDLGPFLIGFGHEAIARAAADVDDVETFTSHVDAARALLPEIADEEQRNILESDLTEMSEV